MDPETVNNNNEWSSTLDPLLRGGGARLKQWLDFIAVDCVSVYQADCTEANHLNYIYVSVGCSHGV